MTTLAPGTIVTPTRRPGEVTVGIVLETPWQSDLRVVWLSSLRGVFVSDEAPDDVDVAAADWRDYYLDGDSIEPTDLATAILALIEATRIAECRRERESFYAG